MKINIKETSDHAVRFEYSYEVSGSAEYWRMPNEYEMSRYYRRITGGHWFEESTRKAFGSKILDIRHGQTSDKWNFFIESTAGYLANKGKRVYEIHRLALDGTIEDHGAYSTPTQARRALEEILKG